MRIASHDVRRTLPGDVRLALSVIDDCGYPRPPLSRCRVRQKDDRFVISGLLAQYKHRLVPGPFDLMVRKADER